MKIFGNEWIKQIDKELACKRLDASGSRKRENFIQKEKHFGGKERR